MKTLNVTNPINRSPFRRALLLIGPALVIIAALTAVPARATPQSGVTSLTIANGTFADIDVYAKTDIDPGLETDFWKARIDTKGASHLYILQNTVIPGGTFGWHSHTGPSLVIVVSGTATEYEGTIRLARPTYTRPDRHLSMQAKPRGIWYETTALPTT